MGPGEELVKRAGLAVSGAALMGGFMMPFAAEAAYNFPPIDTCAPSLFSRIYGSCSGVRGVDAPGTPCGTTCVTFTTLAVHGITV